MKGASALTGLIGAVSSGPGIVVVGPVVAAAIFAKWVYDSYQQT